MLFLTKRGLYKLIHRSNKEIVKFKMSRDSLKKAIENKTPHNGFYWAYA